MSGVNDIRATFLDFFVKRDHELALSSSLVPRNDPTLMFTNSGMVQFKNVFTGAERRDPPRAASAQKCVRAGGKHNDLDNVGYTPRHHTFFEMLGNFSFGDYFKERAIALAWELITREYALDPKRLVITVFADDDDAFSIWKKVTGFSDQKIIRIASSDNFWAMGETGPCGPCSEIFYDHGEGIPGGPPGSRDADGDRFVEIWNLVFMQFDQIGPGERIALPRPSIDTGLGLERLAAVLEGTHDNYEIDLFRHLIRASVEATGVPAEGAHKASHRVIADHLRASVFLIADGVLPSNEGRGYVVRRIMRRAMRHAHLLGAAEPLLHRLVPTLVREMGQAYPELERVQAMAAEALLLEETRFRKTLERGLDLLDQAAKDLSKGAVFPGEVAFKLYDTYGFPIDLTEDALRGRGLTVDAEAYQREMARQRADARKAWTGSGEAATERVWFEIKERSGGTEFLGYDAEAAEGDIVALVRDGAEVKTLEAGQSGAVVVNQTPFYGESGGQVGDRGAIATKDARFVVTDAQKRLGSLLVHQGALERGRLAVGDTVTLEVDHARRRSTRANHSATHLLHEALRRVLGEHVAQKGSLVEPGRLRFDFSHPKPMTPDEIAAVERMANAYVLQNEPVQTRLMDVNAAIESGARALFGEKYGDEVRVVSMGRGPDAGKHSRAYSVELCGGTHVSRLGDIGLIRVVGESAVGAGVRRIEALTGEGARAYLATQDARLRELAELLKTSADEVVPRVTALVEERRKLERQLADARKQAALGGGSADGGEDTIVEIDGIKFMRLLVTGLLNNDLKSLVDAGKQKIGSGVVAVANNAPDGRGGVVVGVTSDLTWRFNAVDLVRKGSEAFGGKGGGGRPDMAQAGGPDGAKTKEAIEAIEKKLRTAG